ncbi:MAG TPA: hypothetical protein VEJ63_11405 [Planctomycetota bacterium]|nr:hypothetical protein [Planctomycetota bacterium]
MLRRLCLFVPFLIAAASFVDAGEPTVVQHGGPTPAQSGENDMLVELLNRLKNTDKLNPTEEGLGLVQARRAKLCDICMQPLYKHADAGFECMPRDPDTGEVKKTAKIETRPANCPSCGEGFIGALRSKLINDKGGIDRDFCIHSVGKYTVHSKVWMCPDCGYAGLLDNWGTNADGTPISAETKKFVAEKLQEPTRKRMITVAGLNAKDNREVPDELKRFSRYVLQTEIPDWLKYDNALKIYEQFKLSHGLMATLYLDAAHACRREVCSEVAVPGLHNSLQVSLGESIRRVQYFLQTECMTLRRRRGDPVTDPTKTELDQKIVAQAALNIIKLGEDMSRNPAAPRTNVGPGARAEDNYLRTGDMYVLHIRLAGAYDRLGRLDDAAKALTKARSFIPERLTVTVDNVENKDLMAYFERQLALLRGVVDDRLECLRREKEYLFNAARSNLAALKFKEVPVKNTSLKPPAPGEPLCFDPAITSYLLAELLRRGGSLPEAAHLFNVADRVLEKYIKDVTLAAERLGDSIQERNKEQFRIVDEQQQRWNKLKDWNDEQRALVKTQDPADEYVRAVGDMLLTAASIENTGAEKPRPPSPISENKEPRPDAVDTSMKKEDPKPAAPEPPKVSSRIKTRSELYVMYYAALKKYTTEKNANPPRLSDLVKDGYVPAEDSCLDGDGKLKCPETKERLLYMSQWKLGDKDAPIISPLKGGTATLFANGEARVGLVR